jgi:hypothetical protein
LCQAVMDGGKCKNFKRCLDSHYKRRFGPTGQICKAIKNNKCETEDLEQVAATLGGLSLRTSGEEMSNQSQSTIDL